MLVKMESAGSGGGGDIGFRFTIEIADNVTTGKKTNIEKISAYAFPFKTYKLTNLSGGATECWQRVKAGGTTTETQMVLNTEYTFPSDLTEIQFYLKGNGAYGYGRIEIY